MAQAKTKSFKVVVVEALDRLSRDSKDLAVIHKRLSFACVEMRAVHDGEADAVMVGLRRLVDQLVREDGAKKVRRSMMGVVRSGRHAGGRAVKSNKDERQRAAGDAVRYRAKIEARREEAHREVDQAIQNLIKGRLSDDEADAVLPKLRAERDRKRDKVAACDSVPKVIALDPAALAQYAATVDGLHQTRADHAHACG